MKERKPFPYCATPMHIPANVFDRLQAAWHGARNGWCSKWKPNPKYSEDLARAEMEQTETLIEALPGEARHAARWLAIGKDVPDADLGAVLNAMQSLEAEARFFMAKLFCKQRYTLVTRKPFTKWAAANSSEFAKLVR